MIATRKDMLITQCRSRYMPLVWSFFRWVTYCVFLVGVTYVPWMLSKVHIPRWYRHSRDLSPGKSVNLYASIWQHKAININHRQTSQYIYTVRKSYGDCSVPISAGVYRSSLAIADLCTQCCQSRVPAFQRLQPRPWAHATRQTSSFLVVHLWILFWSSRTFIVSGYCVTRERPGVTGLYYHQAGRALGLNTYGRFGVLQVLTGFFCTQLYFLYH